MRDATTGICSECRSGPEMYHVRSCSHFKGYWCHGCRKNYLGEYCSDCAPPWWVEALNIEIGTGEP